MKKQLESEEHRIEIGRLGEYGARTVRFKLTEFNNIPSPEQSGEIPELNPSDPDYEYLHHIYYPADGQTWHGNAMVLIHQRSKDFAPYVVENYFVSGDELVWNIGADDTAFEGIGCAEIHMANSGVMLAKSIQYLTYTDERLGSTTEPKPYEEITINTITAIAASALSYKDSAAAFAAAAEDSASDAAASAAAAAESAGAMVNPPYIGANHNWYVWSNDGYVDSGISAQGEPGPNVIDGNTSTTISGMLYGDGSKVGLAPLSGRCETAANVADKVAYPYPPSTGVSPALYNGMTVVVTFVNGNTTNQPTLNYGSTGAKPLTLGHLSSTPAKWDDFSTRVLIYDGLNEEWIMLPHGALEAGDPTTLSGVIAGESRALKALTVDTEPNASHEDNLITSKAVAAYCVPASRTINEKALSQNIRLTGKDIYDDTLAFCDTAANVAAKVGDSGFTYGTPELYPGLMVPVLFTYGNTAQNPTFQYGDTAPKPLLTGFNGLGDVSWDGGETRVLLYDGNGWVMLPLGLITQSSATNLTGLLYGNGEKISAMSIDSSPTSGSTNPVQSGGVYTALSGMLPLISFNDMASENTQANLLAALNAHNSNIPLGVSAVRIGSSSNPNKALILCIKPMSDAGRGLSISPYTDINRLNLYLSSNGWSVVS